MILGDHSKLQLNQGVCEGRKGFHIASCKGVYRDGCAGDVDAIEIVAYCKDLVAESQSQGLILDFRELIYTGGELLEAAFNIETGYNKEEFIYLPVVSVAGPDCREALKSLFGDDFEKVCTDSIPDAIRSSESALSRSDLVH